MSDDDVFDPERVVARQTVYDAERGKGGVDFCGWDLRGLMLRGGQRPYHFDRALLDRATLSGELRVSSFHGAKFRLSRIVSAVFMGCGFYGVDFSGVLIQETRMVGCHFVACSFFEAQLRDLVLHANRFNRCGFNDARLVESELTHNKFSRCTFERFGTRELYLNANAGIEEDTW